jgi:carboxyl-terminal processing protease
MMQNEDKPNRRPAGRLAWVAVAAVMALLSISSIAAPQAFAEETDPQSAEMRHYFQVMESAYQYILQNYVDKVEAKKLYEGAMKGMLESLGDPYSLYLDDALMSSMNDTTEGKFGGIGLSISKQSLPTGTSADTPAFIEVYSVFEDTPGWRAGFKPGDLIVKIAGESTADLSTDQAQGKLRGEAGTKVVITVRRGEGKPFDLTVTRAIIEIPTVKSALIPTKTGNVAYLRIIEFTPQTFPRVKEALKSFDASGYRAMIIDVRSNPGGLLDSVIKIADLFLDKGTIVSTKGRNPYENSVATAKPDLAVPKDKPIVMLIDRGSASAAEILAGALKDNKRAYLVGENSYGKGSVQQIIPVEDTGFKLTMARYYTPSDENINKTGIPPDLVAKEDDLTDVQMTSLQKLIDSGEVETYAKQRPEATVDEQNAFAQKLAASGYALPESILRRLVREEFARKSAVPVYDLEFDTALKAAITTLDDPAFATKLAEAKTVKELVEAKKAAEAAAKDATAAKAASSTTAPAAADGSAAPDGSSQTSSQH